MQFTYTEELTKPPNTPNCTVIPMFTSVLHNRYICTIYLIHVGVHFPTEIEPETSHESATTSPVVESGVSVEHCGRIGVVMCVS